MANRSVEEPRAEDDFATDDDDDFLEGNMTEFESIMLAAGFGISLGTVIGNLYHRCYALRWYSGNRQRRKRLIASNFW